MRCNLLNFSSTFKKLMDESLNSAKFKDTTLDMVQIQNLWL